MRIIRQKINRDGSDGEILEIYEGPDLPEPIACSISRAEFEAVARGALEEMLCRVEEAGGVTLPRDIILKFNQESYEDDTWLPKLMQETYYGMDAVNPEVGLFFIGLDGGRPLIYISPWKHPPTHFISNRDLFPFRFRGAWNSTDPDYRAEGVLDLKRRLIGQKRLRQPWEADEAPVD